MHGVLTQWNFCVWSAVAPHHFVCSDLGSCHEGDATAAKTLAIENVVLEHRPSIEQERMPQHVRLWSEVVGPGSLLELGRTS
jgi:hypothetical protein